MKIEKIKIENFKSIQELELNLYDLTAILWPNSVWKSNILKAIDLVLWEWWTTKWTVKKELFYDSSKILKIEIYFEEKIKWWNYYGNEKLIKCASLIMECNWTSFKCENRLWENSYNDWISGNQHKREWYYLDEDFKRLCSFIYIPSQRDLNSQMRVSSWTMLWKLMQRIFEDYSDNYWTDPETWEVNRKEGEQKLKQAFQEKMEPAKDFLEADFCSNLNFKKFKDIFTKNCCNNSLGLANKFSPELDIYDVNWFYKTLQINISEEWNKEKSFNANDVWSGMQNLLLLSIFQTYAELMSWKVIFWIEEPELFLYPNAQRALYNSFIELSKETQILYTTHNPVFLDASKPDNIIMLQKDKDWTNEISKQNISFTIEDKMRVYTHFNFERNEIFFSKRVVLVEWPSEKMILHELCKSENLDVYSKWVSIIECWWKTWVLYFIWVCRLSWINFTAIWDKDENKKNAKVNDIHWNFKFCIDSWIWFEMDDDLEDEMLKLWYSDYNNSDDKILNAYNWTQSEKKYWIPSHFKSIISYIKDWNIDNSGRESEEQKEVSVENLPF